MALVHMQHMYISSFNCQQASAYYSCFHLLPFPAVRSAQHCNLDHHHYDYVTSGRYCPCMPTQDSCCIPFLQYPASSTPSAHQTTASAAASPAAALLCLAADALAVCAMTTVRVLGAEDLLTMVPLRVGRIDNPKCNPSGQLPPDTATSVEAMDFFTARGLTIDDGTALLGVHALVPTKGCVQ